MKPTTIIRDSPHISRWILLLHLISAIKAQAQPITKESRLLRGGIPLERRRDQALPLLDDLFRRNRAPVATKQAPVDAGGEYLEIGVTFKVASTSPSESEHNVQTADLTAALEIFATTLIQEWAYRKLIEVDDGSSSKAIPHKNRRRLKVTFVSGTASVSQDLVEGIGCIVNVNQVGAGEFPHCNDATGSFRVFADADEDPPQVCRNMEASVNGLMDDDYLQNALAVAAPQSNLILSEGAFDSCSVSAVQSPGSNTTENATSTSVPTSPPQGNIFDQQPSSSGVNATTSAPTSTPELVVTPSPEGNITAAPSFSSDANTTTASPVPSSLLLSIAPTVAASATPVTAPTGTQSPTVYGTQIPTVYQDEWLNVLNGDYEDDPSETGDPWLDVLGTTDENNDDASSPSPTPAPAPVSYHSYREEMERLRQEYYDDSMLDFVIMILSIIWGGLFLIACCCYSMDAAWIARRRRQLIEEDAEYFHEGRWYYDENHIFIRTDLKDKPPPEGHSFNSSIMDLGEQSDDEEDESDAFLSSSEEEEDDDFDFDFDESDDDDDEDFNESGDFYVDPDAEDEEDDDFVETENGVDGEEDFFGEDDGNAEVGEDDDESDFFNDESEVSNLPEQKPGPSPK